MDNLLLGQAAKMVEAMDKTVDDNLPYTIAEIVKFHSKGAAISALGVAWVPGLGEIIAMVTNAGFVWTMYGRIGAEIDLPISKNILKSLASGVITNVASNVVGIIAVSTVLSFVPGLGSVGVSVIVGGTCYALTLSCGYVYLKIMTHLFSNGIDPTTLSEEELKNIAKDIASDSDIKEVVKGAKEEFKSKNKQQEFSKI